MTMVWFVIQPTVLRKILSDLGLAGGPPRLTRPKFKQICFDDGCLRCARGGGPVCFAYGFILFLTFLAGISEKDGGNLWRGKET